jgi:ribonuclease Z
MNAGLNFMKINRIFISHWHADHWAGLIGFMQTLNLEKRKRALEIYGPEAERFVGDILDLDYWGPRFRIIGKNVPFEGSEPTQILKEDRFRIFSIPVQHSVPSVAYAFQEEDSWNVDIKKAESLYGLKQGPLVGKLKEKGSLELKGKTITLEEVGIHKPGVRVVYSGDTRPCRNLVTLAKDSDLFICDATFAEEEESKMHGGAKEAAMMAKKADVKRLALTHFSRRYQDIRELEQEAKKVFPNTIMAEDLMRIKVKK